MSNLGKIIIEADQKDPLVIIAENGNFLRGLRLIKKDDHYQEENSHFSLSSDDINKIENYRGSKLKDRVVDCAKTYSVINLKFKNIGSLSNSAYYRLLTTYNNYQVFNGANDMGYKLVRDEVYNQIFEEKGKSK